MLLSSASLYLLQAAVQLSVQPSDLDNFEIRRKVVDAAFEQVKQRLDKPRLPAPDLPLVERQPRMPRAAQRFLQRGGGDDDNDVDLSGDQINVGGRDEAASDDLSEFSDIDELKKHPEDPENMLPVRKKQGPRSKNGGASSTYTKRAVLISSLAGKWVALQTTGECGEVLASGDKEPLGVLVVRLDKTGHLVRTRPDRVYVFEKKPATEREAVNLIVENCQLVPQAADMRQGAKVYSTKDKVAGTLKSGPLGARSSKVDSLMVRVKLDGRNDEVRRAVETLRFTAGTIAAEKKRGPGRPPKAAREHHRLVTPPSKAGAEWRNSLVGPTYVSVPTVVGDDEEEEEELEGDEPTTSVPRKRGRPRKNAESGEEGAKRRRGRPPKKKKAHSDDSESQSDEGNNAAHEEDDNGDWGTGDSD